MKTRRLWPWVCVALITAVISAPLIGSPIKGDDLFLHYYRIPVLNQLWQNGVFYARWHPDLIFGYGSPLFNFYPPLSAYVLTALYWLVGANGHAALGVFFLLTFALTSSGMYLAARKLFGDFGGVLASAAYTWSPYLLFQPYSRSSLSNALALALFPWAFWAVLRLIERLSWRRVMVTAVFISAIFLSHVVSSILFIAPLIAVATIAALLNKKRRWQTVLFVALGLGLGVGLAAFFWLPAFGEIGATKYAYEASRVDYQAAFANIWQWPAQSVTAVSGASLPKTIGLVQQLAGIVAFTGLSWQLIKKRLNQPTGNIIAWCCCAIGIAGLFITTSASNFVWEIVPQLQGVQFPWRLLDIPVFWLAFGFGWLGAIIQQNINNSWRGAGVVLLLGVMLANATAFLSPPRTGLLPKRPLIADATAVQQQVAIYGLTAWGEYSSSAVTEWPSDVPFAGADQFAPLSSKLINKPERFELFESSPWSLAFRTASDVPQLLPLTVHDFPGWKLFVDGERTPLTISDTGNIQLALPAGEHHVSLQFNSTPIRTTGNVISLFSLIALLALSMRLAPIRTSPRLRASALSPSLKPLAIALLALLLIKIAVIDQLTTPLMRQRTETDVSTLPQPTPNNFGAVELLAVEQRDPDQLTLYWQAHQTPAEPYRVALLIFDGNGRLLKEIINPNPGYNVMTSWEAGQLVRDDYTVPLDIVAPPVAYNISVQLLSATTDEPLVLMDGAVGETAVHIASFKQAPPPRPVEAPLDVRFNEQIGLVETAVSTNVTDQTISFDLIWESVASVDINYTVFVHLLTPDGEIVEQRDAQPTDGVYPTSAWEVGERIVDHRAWVTSAPPGTYLLQIGLYDLQTGTRLSVTGDNTFGDRAVIGEIEIVP